MPSSLAGTPLRSGWSNSGRRLPLRTSILRAAAPRYAPAGLPASGWHPPALGGCSPPSTGPAVRTRRARRSRPAGVPAAPEASQHPHRARLKSLAPLRQRTWLAEKLVFFGSCLLLFIMARPMVLNNFSESHAPYPNFGSDLGWSEQATAQAGPRPLSEIAQQSASASWADQQSRTSRTRRSQGCLETRRGARRALRPARIPPEPGRRSTCSKCPGAVSARKHRAWRRPSCRDHPSVLSCPRLPFTSSPGQRF